MSQITEAIAAKQRQLAQLQSDIEALKQAATILGEGTETATAAQPAEETAPAPEQQPKAKPTRSRVRPETDLIELEAVVVPEAKKGPLRGDAARIRRHTARAGRRRILSGQHP